VKTRGGMSRPDELTNLLDSFARYRAYTDRLLDAVPDDRLLDRPVDGARSIAETFLHIAGAESFYVRGLLTGEWDFDVLSPSADIVNRNSIAANLSTSRAATQVLVRGLDAARLAGAVDVPGAHFDGCLAQWLWYVLEHEIHHQGQLATCLRAIGVAPPQTGPDLPA